MDWRGKKIFFSADVKIADAGDKAWKALDIDRRNPLQQQGFGYKLLKHIRKI